MILLNQEQDKFFTLCVTDLSGEPEDHHHPARGDRDECYFFDGEYCVFHAF
jgi:hypothetical protein